MPYLCILLAGLLLVVNRASAAVWTVESNGSGDVSTIQAGIDSAAAGDTVLVGVGTHFEHSIVMKSGIVLLGEGAAPDSVVIDAQQLGRVLDCSNTDTTTLVKNLTITGGTALVAPDTSGGGIFAVNADLRIMDSVIRSNAAIDGGGVAIWGSANPGPRITSCVVDSNAAQDRGGGIYCRYGEVTVTQSTVCANQAANGAGGYSQTDLTVSFCKVTGNMATGLGGGWYQTEGTLGGNPSFTASRIDSNQAGNGGGLYLWLTEVSVVSCTMSCNIVTGSELWSLGGGGAVLVMEADATFDSCLFESNESGATGGGLLADASNVTIRNSTLQGNSALRGGALGGWFALDVQVTRSKLVGNNAVNGGGGLYAFGSPFHITHTTILGNDTPGDGGAIATAGSDITIDTTVIAGNTAAHGSVIFSGQLSSPGRFDDSAGRALGIAGRELSNRESMIKAITLSNVSCVQNTATTEASLHLENVDFDIDRSILAFNTNPGPAISCQDPANVSVTCTNLFDNTGGDWVGCVAGIGDSSGNLHVDPLFCDTTTNDYTLEDTSPLLSAPGCGLIGARGAGCETPTNVIDHADFTVRPLQLLGPNPTRTGAHILLTPSHDLLLPAELRVFDISGRLVRTLRGSEGARIIEWDGNNDEGLAVAAGTYFISLISANTNTGLKLILLR